MRAQIQVVWFDRFPLARCGQTLTADCRGRKLCVRYGAVPGFRQVPGAQTTNINLEVCECIVVYSSAVTQLQIDAHYDFEEVWNYV